MHSGFACGHWSKIKILEFKLLTCRYWKYILWGSWNCFYFFSNPKDELSRAFQSYPNLHFLTFLLKNGQNLTLKCEICRWSSVAISTKFFLVYKYILKMLWKFFRQNRFWGPSAYSPFYWQILPIFERKCWKVHPPVKMDHNSQMVKATLTKLSDILNLAIPLHLSLFRAKSHV